MDEDEEDLEEELQSCNVERCQVRVTPPAKPRLRIREDVRDQHCRTLRQALHVWMDQFPEDFDDPPNYNSLTHLEAFCRRVLPNSELDIKVHRKASQIRRPMEPSPPHKLGYPTGSSKPPPLVLKSANLVNGLNNNSVHHHFHAYAKDRQPFNEDLAGGGGPTLQTSSQTTSADHHGDLQYADFLDIPETLFALQLTRMDCVRLLRREDNSVKLDRNFEFFFVLQELFRRVIPHQCLGAVWSRRDKSRDRDAASVVATVEQFNAVSYRVISTILIALDTKPQHRAKVISKWIDIAQVSK